MGIVQLLGYIVKICERQREINKLKRQEIRKQNELDGKPENTGIETEYLEKGEEVMNYWIEEGRELGILEEARRMLMEALTTKFNNVSNAIENIIQEIKDRNVLSNLHREAILSNNLNEFKLRLEACR